MTRQHLTFSCEGEVLVGTLDNCAARVGLLIVSGGSEIRSGAFAGQAQLAAHVAARGYPVFRFDRRGVGDSSGRDAGYRASVADIAAALAAFRAAAPQVERVVALGNCDAASALMLATGAQCDGLVLTNPWTFDAGDDQAMPPAAVRARYLAKLSSPREWWRLLSGGIALGRLLGGLRTAASSAPAPSSLASEMQATMQHYRGDARFLVSGNDRTGLAFVSAWQGPQKVASCKGASHAFVELDSREWLYAEVLVALHEQARQLDMR